MVYVSYHIYGILYLVRDIQLIEPLTHLIHILHAFLNNIHFINYIFIISIRAHLTISWLILHPLINLREEG